MKNKDNKIHSKEVIRFLLSGCLILITDFTVYKILQSVKWDLSMAKAGSYICGTILGFLLNKLWTFESRIFSRKEVLRYVMLYIFSAFINVGVNRMVLKTFPMQIVAYLCATGISTVINFLGQKFFVFARG